MQYLGGKAKLAKRLLPFFQGSRVFEPFMGGANVSVHLPSGSVCGDLDPALVALYQCVSRFGVDWISDLSEAQYLVLKSKNDPKDPYTAVAKYGLSFAGKPWGGFARSARASFAPAVRRSLAPLFGRGLSFYQGDFLDIQPQAIIGFVAYLDPPYFGRTGYRVSFDHARFVTRCLEWAAYMPVFVSEYTRLHESWVCVQEFPKAANGLQVRSADAPGETEKLFRVVL